MDALEYMERETNRTLTTVIGDFKSSHETTQKAVAMLVGGGGAAGTYALARLAEGDAAATWVPIAALSIWWFLIAAFVMVKGLKSHKLSSGPLPNDLGNFYKESKGNFGPATDSQNIHALTLTRLAELASQNDTIEEYMAAIGFRARLLNQAYLAAAASPVPALIAFAVASR